MTMIRSTQTLSGREPFEGLPPIMADCVSDYKNDNQNMNSPWTQGEHIYACDGQIIVRARQSAVEGHIFDALETLEITREKNNPDVLFKSYCEFIDNILISLPENINPFMECKLCHGKGTIRDDSRRCTYCDGSGSLRNRLGCDVTPCIRMTAWIIGLLSFHQARCYQTGRSVLVSYVDPIYFMADGCEGLTMPLGPSEGL